MRLRNIPGSREIIAKSEYVVHCEDCAGHWQEIFGDENPLHIEIGMGKGRFLIDMAKKYPKINFVGIEKYSSVLLRALEKLDEMEAVPQNLRFLRMDAEEIENYFSKGEVKRIYLNFSDPWPKDRNAKRRLTSTRFLHRYENILSIEGTVEFKTDNVALFDFSLESAKEADWELLAMTRDLHHDEKLLCGNVMTEYEEKFSSLGNPICKLIIRREDPLP